MAGSAGEKTKTYVLRHPGHCTGMFWRPPPTGERMKQVGGDDWPRNGSVLTGHVHEEEGKPVWLEVTEWTQNGSTKKVTECVGLWMPFEQGGLLLHEKK